MIRTDAIWVATEPMDMRAGTDTALARVVAVFGARSRTVLISLPTAER
jgi:transposase